MHDVWADGQRGNEPIDPSNSVWFASSAGSLTAAANLMTATADAASSRMWVGYFVSNSIMPVDLDVGRAMKVRLVFTPNNVAGWAGSGSTTGFRIGLFNYADGGTRLAADGSFTGASGNGAGVTGYLLNQSFYTNFSNDEPIELLARSSLASANLMGTTGDFTELGSGPAGYSNAPGFQSGTQYTFEMTVTRAANTTTHVAARFQGGDLDIQHSVVDTNFAYRRFDAIGVRANRNTDTADTFQFTEFKVEVVNAAVPFPITSVQLLSPDAFKLTWNSISSRVYQVQSRTNLTAGIWTTNATVTALSSATSYTNSGVLGSSPRFFRVAELP